jgi:siroheme synthase
LIKPEWLNLIKLKKQSALAGMAENERNDMLNKFKSAGGKVVREKEDKPQQQPRNTQKMKALGGKDEKSKSSSSGGGSEKKSISWNV